MIKYNMYFYLDNSNKPIKGCIIDEFTPVPDGTVVVENPSDEFIDNFRQYTYIDGKFVKDNDYIKPEFKHPIQLLQEDNDALKKENAELKSRVEVMQGALDSLIMESFSV